jgi:hypothetical protein
MLCEIEWTRVVVFIELGILLIPDVMGNIQMNLTD